MKQNLKDNDGKNISTERVSKLLAHISIVGGVLVLLGWAFNIQWLKSILPGLVSMKANTAIGFVLLGSSLILHENKKNVRLFSKIIAGFVLVLGLLTLSQYIFKINLGIDQLLFLDNPGAILTSSPGRMAPSTALMFILLSSSVISFQSQFGERIAQVVVLFVVATGFVTFMGYAYGVTSLFYFHNYTAMALHSAILLVLISLSILFSTPQIGIMNILLNRNVGGDMVRKILPVVILLPFLIGWLHVKSQYIGMLPLGAAEILLDVINITLFTMLILWFANSLNKVDINRKQSEEELIKQNASLNAVMNNSHSVMIFLVNKNYELLAFNENHKKEIKRLYSLDIKLGVSLLDYITISNAKEKIKASIDRVLSGETFIESIVLPQMDIYHEYHWNTVKQRGEVIGASCFIIDITERITIDIAFHNSEESYRRFFDEDLSGNYKTTPDGKILQCNKAFVKMLGYESIEQVMQMNAGELYQARSEREDFLSKLKENGKLELVETTLLGFNGRIIHVIENVLGKYDNFGELVEISGYMFDITDRKKAEQEIIESEKKYRQLIENASEIILLTDKSGNFIYANEAALKFSGYSFEEMTSFNFLDLVHNDHKKKVGSFYYRQLVRKDETTSLQFPFYTKDRSFKWLEQNVKLLTEGEKITGFQLIARDITERIEAEEKVMLLSRAVENSPASIMITDAEGNIEYVNKKFIELTGYALDELIGKNPRLLKSGEKSEEDYKTLWETIKSGKEWRGEFHNKKKNGELYWESASIVQVKNGKTFFLAVKEDITERKKNEAKILLLANALESISECVSITDHSNIILFTNKAFRETYGYSDHELIGKNINMVRLHSDSDGKTSEILPNTKDGGWSGEIANCKKDGTIFPVYLSTAIIKDTDGNPTALIGVATDITQRLGEREELIKAKDKAEVSNKLKDYFIENISHEIRTPLNGILGMTSIIKEIYSQNISSEEESYFTAVNTSSERIIRTIDLILNYSQLETGTFNFVPARIELSAICKSLINKFSGAADAKSLFLSFENKIGQAVISASEYSMVTVISNLIENALIFTKSGFVKVQLYQSLQDEILLDIIDSGIGISDEYLDHIFEPFRQEQMGYGRPYEGLGLGLALVKKILDLHDATISVKSKKGEGTTFSINFGIGSNNVPQKFIVPNTSVNKETTERKTERVVLVVEDDKINQALIKRFINEKYNTLEADSYNSIMGILAANKVDLILMDISLQSSMDGLEITKALKASSEYNHIPVIAATAHALERDHQAVMAAGCDGYLAKPFSKGQLLLKIDEFLS